MRRAATRRSRVFGVASKVQMEMLEQRIMLSVTPAIESNPIAPPPLPSQPTPLQGVVGTPNSLDPQLLNDAYDFAGLSYDIHGTVSRADGAGETIAIVDAYGSPTIINDVQAFDAETYLSPGESEEATTGGISNYDAEGNFFLSVVKLGTTANTIVEPTADIQSWSKETSMDVEWAHAIAPGAHILLVEAASDSAGDLLDADVYAAEQPGVVAVSDSWGGPPDAQIINGVAVEPQTLDGYLVSPNGHLDNNGMTGGVVFLASSGDNGANSFPAASYNVLSVGGETTTVGLNGIVQNFGPWNNALGSSGGGESTTNPAYHDPIVALDADPETGVWVYNSSPDPGDGPTIQGGWSVIGGTSFSCPAWSGLIAIVDQGLNLRGYGSMNNYQVDGLEPYDDRGTTAPGDESLSWTTTTVTTTPTTTTTVTPLVGPGSPVVTTVVGATTPVGLPTTVYDTYQVAATAYGIEGVEETSLDSWSDLVQPGVPAPKEDAFALWAHTQTVSPVATSSVISPPVTLSTVTTGTTITTVTETITTTTTTTTTTTAPAPGARVPDITLTPNNGNTGWGWPDELNGASPRGGFIQDMVGGPTIAEGGNVTIYSDSIDSLYFTQQPVNTVAGEPISSTSPGLQVTAFTPTTNGVDTAFNGVADTVTIDILEAGTLLGTTTAVPVNGVATFSGLHIDQIGTYEFIASSPNVNPAFSNAFNIMAGAPTHLAVVEQPASFWQYSLMTSPVVIAAEDRFNNITYLASGSKVALSILSGPAGAVLSGQTTSTFFGGLASFSGLTASLPGTYVLIAQSSGLGSTNTSPFAEVPITVTERYTFNGAPLSSNAMIFQQFRNAQVYSSQGPPTNAEAQQVIFEGNLNLNFLVGQFADSGATPTFAASSSSAASASTDSPFASGDSSGGSNLESQLLDSGSGDNKLLD